MDSEQQKIVQKVREAFRTVKYTVGRERAWTKAENERTRAEIELIMDDLVQEGINPLSPLGLTCIVEIMKDKVNKIAEEVRRRKQRERNHGFPEGW